MGRKSITGEAELLEYARSKTVLDDHGCHVWQSGHKTCTGNIRYGNRLWQVERLMWTLKNGELQPRAYLKRTCGNAKCVNPDHHAMMQGTHRTKGTGTHCPNGHPRDGANEYKSSQGARRCRACDREVLARLNKKRREARRCQNCKGPITAPNRKKTCGDECSRQMILAYQKARRKR